MPKTSIKVTYVGANQEGVASFSLFLFLFAGLIGGSLLAYRAFPPVQTPVNNLASVESAPPEVSAPLSIAAAEDHKEEGARVPPSGEVAGAATETETPDPLLTPDEIALRMREILSDIAVEKSTVSAIVSEMELIKNEAVFLAAEFERNCGSWDAPCAAQYAEPLEKHNTRYIELQASLDAHTRVLDALEREQGALAI